MKEFDVTCIAINGFFKITVDAYSWLDALIATLSDGYFPIKIKKTTD